ncbi:hypothetical protein [Pseudomonas helleri]|uniref:hypothetical protein n=1 Tax=Pseudomonas helleri TaxID=1608996 RepID=UPI003F94E388
MERKLLHTHMHTAELILRETEPGVMYRYMENHGYRYATLALGVAEQNTLAGVVALSFMKETAAAQGVPIDDVKVDSVLRSMASEYIKALSLQNEGGIITVARDIRYDEAWKFHSKVFIDAGYSPDAWTLNSVFSVLPDADCEAYWNKVLASAGDTRAELELAVNTYVLMRLVQINGSEEAQQTAEQWLDRIESMETTRVVVDLGSEKLKQGIDGLLSDLSGYFKGLSGFIFGQPAPPFYTPAPTATPPIGAVPIAPSLPAVAVPSPPAKRRKKRRGGGRPPTTADGYNNGGHFNGGGDRLRIDH